MPWDQFPGNRPNRPQSPNDVASRPLPKSPVSSSRDNVVPQMIVRSPRVRPGKFVFGEAKRVLQHYLPTAEATRTGEHWRGRQTAIAINSLAMGTAMRERDLSSRAVCVPLGPQVWRRGCGSRLPARSLETRGNGAPHSAISFSYILRMMAVAVAVATILSFWNNSLLSWQISLPRNTTRPTPLNGPTLAGR